MTHQHCTGGGGGDGDSGDGTRSVPCQNRIRRRCRRGRSELGSRSTTRSSTNGSLSRTYSEGRHGGDGDGDGRCLRRRRERKKAGTEDDDDDDVCVCDSKLFAYRLKGGSRRPQMNSSDNLSNQEVVVVRSYPAIVLSLNLMNRIIKTTVQVVLYGYMTIDRDKGKGK